MAAPPAPGDDVYIGSSADTGNLTVNEDVTIAIHSLTMGAKTGKNGNATTLTVIPNAILTVNNTISLGANTTINGAGTLIANGAISGGGAISASSGLLNLSGNGSIAGGGAVLSIGTSVPSTLELNLSGGITTGAITINNANQTLEIGPQGLVTITAAEKISNGTLQMAGGTLIESSGIVLGTGNTGGTLTGSGIVHAAVSKAGGGSNVIKAAGGTLDLTGAIGSGPALEDRWQCDRKYAYSDQQRQPDVGDWACGRADHPGGREHRVGHDSARRRHPDRYVWDRRRQRRDLSRQRHGYRRAVGKRYDQGQRRRARPRQ